MRQKRIGVFYVPPAPTPTAALTGSSCEQFVKQEFDKNYADAVVAKSWDPYLPKPLQKLPEGVSLCGYAPFIPATILLSNEADEQNAFNFYRSQLLSLGCIPQDIQTTKDRASTGVASKDQYTSALPFACKTSEGLIQVGYVIFYKDQKALLITTSRPSLKPSTGSANPTP